MTLAKEALKSEAAALRDENSKLAPLEQELDGIKLAHLQAVTESNTHKEQYEAERQKLIDAESSLQDMSTKLNEVPTNQFSSPFFLPNISLRLILQANEQVSSLTGQVSQLQTEKEDIITEHKIEERKSQRMVTQFQLLLCSLIYLSDQRAEIRIAKGENLHLEKWYVPPDR